MAETTGDAKQLANKYVEIWNTKEFARFSDVVAESFTFVTPNRRVEGRDNFEAYVREVTNAFPDFRITVQKLLADENLVIAEGTVAGTHEGEFDGIPPTGETFEVRDRAQFIVNDGKLQEVGSFFDQQDVLSQLDLHDTMESESRHDDQEEPRTKNAEKLEEMREIFEYMREASAYYNWLDLTIVDVKEGLVRLKIPQSEKVRPPDVGPTEGMNGGIIMTGVDAVGMAAILMEEMEYVPLATTDIDVNLYDSFSEDYIFEGEAEFTGDRWATADIRVYPESELGVDDPALVATGTAAAQLYRE